MNIGIGISLANYRPVPTAPLEDPDAAIAALFSSGEVGAWYDPSDLDTVFQDAAGTTPATVGDPVGLILDKSKGLTLGSSLITNGTFDTDTAGWTADGSNTIASVGGELEITLNSAVFSGATSAYSTALQIGKFYKLVVTARKGTTSTNFVVRAGVVSNAEQILFTSTSNETKELIFLATAATTSARVLTVSTGISGTIYIDNISVRELPGNHATQTTSAARPVLQSSGGLYYLDFDGVDDWMTTGAFAAGVQAQPNSIGIGFKFDNYTTKLYDFVYDSPSTVAPYPNRHTLFDGSGNLRGGSSSGYIAITSSTLNNTVSFGNYNQAASYFRVNGTQSSTYNVGTEGWVGINLGSHFLGQLNTDGRIYSFVGVNRTLTAGEIADLENYLAAKSGFTAPVITGIPTIS